jgi:hypothetical protein
VWNGDSCHDAISKAFDKTRADDRKIWLGNFDKNALTDQILMLIDNSDLRKKLGNNARNTIIDHYDLNKICLPKQLNWATSLIDK